MALSDTEMDDHDESVEQGPLFNDSILRINDKKGSLSVLANCVFLVNATILKERKLLPDQLFYNYKVYDSVFGYAVNQKDPDGSKLAVKMRACQKAIEQQKLYKLAIVVEEHINCEVQETFIWTFSYDSVSSARASIKAGKNHTTSFNVDVRDMKQTIQQFCKVFSELQEILRNLDPMPRGMVPTLRVAFRSDEPSPYGFQPTDIFVNVDKLSDVGHVSFPENMKFHLQYHSVYDRSRLEASAVNDLEMSDERIEGPRHETMRETMHDDYEYRNSPTIRTAPEVDDDVSIENNNPESRFEEHKRLQSEINQCSIEEPRMIEEVDLIEENEPEQMDVDQDHQEEEVEVEEEGVEVEVEEKEEEEEEEEEGKEEEEEEEERPSKLPRKFGRVKSVLDEDETQRNHSVAKETTDDEIVNQEKLVPTRFGATYNFAVINKTKKKKITSDVVAVTVEQPAKRFGRVSAILKPTQDILTPPQEISRRSSPRIASKRMFGRVSSILELTRQNTGKEAAPTDNAIDNLLEGEQAEQHGPTAIATEEESPVNRYGRVSSLTSRTVKQSKYGHSSSIRPK